MPGSHSNLITHPVRARILAALMGRRLTAKQVADLLGDVPLPSVYRHVRLLVDAGILQPVEETRVNGTLTQIYAVAAGQARITSEEVRDATRADHLQYLTTFLNTLAENYRAYLEYEPPGSLDNLTHAFMEALHLSPQEFKAFCEGLSAFLKPWRENLPGGERRRMVFAHILVPDRADPPLS